MSEIEKQNLLFLYCQFHTLEPKLLLKISRHSFVKRFLPLPISRRSITHFVFYEAVFIYEPLLYFVKYATKESLIFIVCFIHQRTKCTIFSFILRHFEKEPQVLVSDSEKCCDNCASKSKDPSDESSVLCEQNYGKEARMIFNVVHDVSFCFTLCGSQPV